MFDVISTLQFVNELLLRNRVFQMKLNSILDDIINKQVFGRVVGRVWVIEYQKRYIHSVVITMFDV